LFQLVDEEEGGSKGMKPFIQTDEFQSLNVGFALDEGSTSQDDTLLVVWAERASWSESRDFGNCRFE
jgi:aminoacylase